MTKAYTSNLTRDQFEVIEPLLPAAKPGGRPRTTCLWAVLNALFYLVKQGCSWRDLPGDFPAWQTVYTYYRTWVNDGTWDAIHDRLRAWIRVSEGRHESPSEVILDSQSVAWCIEPWALMPPKRPRDGSGTAWSIPWDW